MHMCIFQLLTSAPKRRCREPADTPFCTFVFSDVYMYSATTMLMLFFAGVTFHLDSMYSDNSA